MVALMGSNGGAAITDAVESGGSLVTRRWGRMTEAKDREVLDLGRAGDAPLYAREGEVPRASQAP